MKRFAVLVLLLLVLSSTVAARVVVNEAMANEPGSNTALEWIELYNDGAASINLGFYSVLIGTSSLSLNGSIGAGQYLILAADSLAFKAAWQGAGIPTYRLMEGSFSLTNSADTVTVVLLTTVESQLWWTTAGKDGYSWERTQSGSNVVRQSVDYAHATPGYVNSVTPLPNDLSLDSLKAAFEGDGTVISYFVTNRSLVTISNGTVSLYYQKPGSVSADSLITFEFLQPIDTGYSSLLAVRYDLPELYAPLVGRVGSDDRARNDSAFIVAPGRDFPPVRLNEILPNPEAGLTSEWVEIHNVYTDSIDISGWQLGDALNLYRIANSSFKVAAQQYLVLAEDSAAFRTYYPSFNGQLFQPSDWAQLNDGGDIARLTDTFGYEGDRRQYTEVYTDNVTLSRKETPSGDGEWARSDSSGGTPGRSNTIRTTPASERIGLTILPQIFSPDGDGIEDEAVLTAAATAAEGYTLEIYDREGRKVRVLEDNASTLKEEYRWDGRGDDGVRQPVGIYIVYFNSVGVESIKKTVVIAP